MSGNLYQRRVRARQTHAAPSLPRCPSRRVPALQRLAESETSKGGPRRVCMAVCRRCGVRRGLGGCRGRIQARPAGSAQLPWGLGCRLSSCWGLLRQHLVRLARQGHAMPLAVKGSLHATRHARHTTRHARPVASTARQARLVAHKAAVRCACRPLPDPGPPFAVAPRCDISDRLGGGAD